MWGRDPVCLLRIRVHRELTEETVLSVAASRSHDLGADVDFASKQKAIVFDGGYVKWTAWTKSNVVLHG